MMEDSSSMLDRAAAASDINGRIALVVRELRIERGLTLDRLARRCGVSRSMISLIERGESSPTAVVLDRLAAGLAVPLAALFDAPRRQGEPQPLARRRDQPAWRDPASGYVRRNLSPAGHPSPIQMVEVSFPPGARVAFESGPRGAAIHQQVWVIDGAIEVTVGDEPPRTLRRGDCLAMTLLDQATAFRNPARKAARYVVVVVSGHAGARRP
jgi:transcriptional regulator with XRE-family HTH domain